MYVQGNPEGGSFAFKGKNEWIDYTIDADIKPIQYNNGGFSIHFRAMDTGNGYLTWITPDSISLGVKKDWEETSLGSAEHGFPVGMTQHLRITLSGNDIKIYINDEVEPLISVTDAVSPSGMVGMSTWNASAAFDNIVVRDVSGEDDNSEELLTSLGEIEADYGILEAQLAIYDNEALKPRELIASKEVVKIYIDIIRSDIAGGYTELAAKELEQIRTILDKASEDLSNENYSLTAEKSVKGIKISNGRFINKDRKSFFPRGIIWFDEYANPNTDEGMEILKNTGLNIIDTSWTTPSNVFAEEGASPEYSTYLTDLVQKAYDNNLLLDILAQPNDMPEWFKTKYPEAFPDTEEWYLPFDIENQDVKELIKKYIQYHITALLQKSGILKDTILGIDMANEPATDAITALTLKNFGAVLRKKYGTIAALNTKWGASFTSFNSINDAVELRNLIAKNKNAHYDWSQYSFDRFTNYFKWFGDAIDKYAKGKQMNKFVKSPENYYMLDAVDCNFMSRVNLEMLCSTTEIMGTDTFLDDSVNEFYNMNSMTQSFLFDMYKSFDKNKPIYDSEWHSVDSVYYQNQNIRDGYMREALRLATWHGLSGVSLWTYARAGASEWFYDGANLMGQPKVLNEFLTESHAIDNEMDIVSLFPQASRKVGILFSMTSTLRDGKKYLNQLKDMYQALYFQDSSIAVVTEDMLEENSVKDLEFLVIPNARYITKAAFNRIRTLSSRGVKILVLGAAMQFDEEGNTLTNTKLRGSVKRINTIDIDGCLEKIEGIMKWAKVSRKYQLVDSNMKHPSFVEARFTETTGGAKIGYAINLGNTEQTFAIVNTRTGKAVNIKNTKYNIADSSSITTITLAPGEYISFNIDCDSRGIPFGFTWKNVLDFIEDVPDEEIIDKSDVAATVPVDEIAVSTPPVIDGDMSEWSSAAGFELNDSVQVVGITNWRSSDVSGKGYIRWDSDNLYVSMTVKDNVHEQTKTGENIWTGDGIQIAIDPTKGTQHDKEAFIEMGFAVTNDGAVQKYRWSAVGGLPIGVMDNVDCAVVRDETLKATRYEIAIPWEEIAADSSLAVDDLVLGFSILINDNDGSGRKGYIEYYGGIGSLKNSEAFGDLTLRPESYVPPGN